MTHTQGSRVELNEEWQRRLSGQLRANISGDLVAQMVLLVTALVIGSGWTLTLWLDLWVVLTGLMLARRLVRLGHRRPALIAATTGHIFGAVVATAILPEIAPVTMAIVIGDLQLWYEHVGTAGRGFRRFAVVFAATIGALSLQNWTRLGERVHEWVLIAFLLGFGIGVSSLCARQSFDTIATARRRGQEIARSGKRLQMADDEARRVLAESIAAGPRRQLDDVRAFARGTSVDDEFRRDRDTAPCQRALAVANGVWDDLRAIAHGLRPLDPTHGLALALSSIPWATTPKMSVDIPSSREPHGSVRDAVVDIAAEVAAWARRNRAVVETVNMDWRNERLRFLFTLAVDAGGDRIEALLASINDLAGAAGGEIDVAVSGTTARIGGTLPPPIARPLPPRNSAAGVAVALQMYLRGALVMTGGGLVAIALAYVVHPSGYYLVLAALVVLIAALLALAGHELRRGHVLRGVVLTSLETSLSAVGLMLLMPVVAPALLVITLLTLFVAPSIVSAGQFVALAAVQQLTMAFVLVAEVVHPESTLTDILTPYVEFVLLVTVPVALVALLISVYGATMQALEGDNTRLRAARREIVRISRERRRALERDLHDGAQQVVLALVLQLQVLLTLLDRHGEANVERRLTLIQAVDEADDALAAFAAGSYPRVLLEDGFTQGIRRAAQLCPHQTEVSIEVGKDLPASIEAATYLCCSEALQNAAKHAGAGARVTVTVRERTERLEFEVADTGVGFDVAHARGQGLHNMRTRVGPLLGDLQIESAPGRGCTVRGWLPLSVELASSR
jgi:signal transduction histidine kinase